MTARATLAAMHARCMTQAMDLERLASTRADDDPDAMQSRDEAYLLRIEADALRCALEHMGGVFIPAPGQLSLFSDGGPQS